MAVYSSNGVFIDHGSDFIFGGTVIKTKSSNAGGDTIVPGLHAVLVEKDGFFSTNSRVLLSYYDGKPNRVVWLTSTEEAEAIADAIREVTGCY